jgi:hypothetical protein
MGKKKKSKQSGRKQAGPGASGASTAPERKMQPDGPSEAPLNPAVDEGITNPEFADLSPKQKMLNLGYVFMIVSAIFLVNSLEPDNKGETGGIGIVTGLIGVALFVYARYFK